MDRRRFLAGAVGVLVAPVAAEAQPMGKVPRIGVLLPGKAPRGPGLEAFRQGLRNLGYVEGRHIALEVRWDEEKLERTPELAADLVRLKVDIIVAGNTLHAQAARNATSTIPIVMAIGPYAVEMGLVQSLARPGGNVTGFSLLTRELTAKRLQLLKEAVPSISRVAYFRSAQRGPTYAAMNNDHEAAASQLGVELWPVEVAGPGDFDGAFRAAVKARAGAAILAQGAMFSIHRARLAELAVKHRLPMMSGETGSAEAGTLLYYGSDLFEGWRRAATYVDKILKGAKPADLPVEQPTKFELVVNLRTAKALGLTIPSAVLARADEVIQ